MYLKTHSPGKAKSLRPLTPNKEIEDKEIMKTPEQLELEQPDGSAVVVLIDDIKELLFESADFSYWLTYNSAIALKEYLNKNL